MGNNDTGDPPETEKTSLPLQTQGKPASHPYPDWPAMQACYGPGMVPPPYFGSAVAPVHSPHPYMWGPQSMILPFGTPYTTVYPPGVYPHPAMHLMATPPSVEMPSNSLGSREKLPTKRHKGSNGLSTSNGNTQSSIGADVNGLSQSGYISAEGSSNGSSENNAGEGPKSPRIQSSEDLPSSGKPLGAQPSPCPTSTIDTRLTDTGKLKAIGTSIPSATGVLVPARNGVLPELQMQDERELKRERRKQSNRESARRSRLTKQAETEELATKVDHLNDENTSLISEISRLIETSDKLRLENLALTEKLKDVQPSQMMELSLDNMEAERPPVVENFLSIIDNTNTIRRADKQEESNGMPLNSPARNYNLTSTCCRELIQLEITSRILDLFG